MESRYATGCNQLVFQDLFQESTKEASNCVFVSQHRPTFVGFARVSWNEHPTLEEVRLGFVV